jgi:hypothetical protein
MRRLCRRFPRLHLENFPAYAPELNPDEGVWGHLNDALTNGRLDDLDELVQDMIDSLWELHTSQAPLRNCIYRSELSLFLP